MRENLKKIRHKERQKEILEDGKRKEKNVNALTLPTSGGRSVGIVCWRTKAPEFRQIYEYLKFVEYSYVSDESCLNEIS
jgi:hypothetical protein